jgi:phosphoribosylpyrophosphate synthetase
MKEVVLLADEKSHAWNFAEKIHDYLLEKYECDVPLHDIEIVPFNNKEPQMHVPGLLRQKDVYFVHDSNLFPATWWEQLLLTSDLVLNASAKSLTFVLPDMHYSRQDRKHKHHVPISARALAASISPGLRRIITMELHSP